MDIKNQAPLSESEDNTEEVLVQRDAKTILENLIKRQQPKSLIKMLIEAPVVFKEDGHLHNAIEGKMINTHIVVSLLRTLPIEDSMALILNMSREEYQAVLQSFTAEEMNEIKKGERLQGEIILEKEAQQILKGVKRDYGNDV